MKNLNEQISRIRKVMGLNESVVYDYVKKSEDRYEFMSESGLRYEVHIVPLKGYDFKTYEVSFGVKGEGSEYESKLGLVHLNSVLATVSEIVEGEIKSKGIRKIIVNPSYGERDVENPDTKKIFDPNLRYQLYLRFLTNRYSKDAVNPGFGKIAVDATKIFPELFNQENKMSVIMGILNGFNDGGQMVEVGDFDGSDDNNFSYNGDIENSDKGGVYVVINVNDNWKEYNVEIEFYDDDKKYEDQFNSFEELVKYIKTILI
jgi:hypothetical protein